MAINLTSGERIDDLIKLTGKSTENIAADLSISKATMSDIINNVDKGYNYKYFVSIAKYFNVSTDYLLCLTDSKIPINNKDGKSLRISCDYTGLSEMAINHITSPPILNTLIVNNLIGNIQVPDIMMLFDKKHSDVKAKVFESTEFYELISLLSYRAVKSELYALSVNQLLNDLQGNSYRLTKSEKAQINTGQTVINTLGNEIKALTLDIEQKYQKFFNDITENASSDINKFADMLNDEISKIEVIDNA